MALPRTSTTTKGSRSFLHVDLDTGATPSFPPSCPCCLAPVERGGFILAKRGKGPALRFPACRACARHAAILDRVGAVTPWLVGGLTLLTVGGFIVYRATGVLGSKGLTGGWLVSGTLLALLGAVGSPIRAGVTLLACAVVFILYGLLFAGLLYPLKPILGKPACAFWDELSLSRGYGDGQFYHRFTFENRTYGNRFAQVNGPSAPAAAARPERKAAKSNW